jgi:hypothetical protein
MSSAAFQAMREVVGELVAADSIDLSAVPIIAIESGAYSPIIPTRPPLTRPVGIRSVNLPEVFASHDDQQWLDSVDDDLVRPQVEGFHVVAATAIHKRGFRDRNWRTEQYFGPSSEAESGDLSERIRHLPEGFVTDHVNLRSRHVSPGAIVHPRAIIAGSIGKNTLMLCPLIADKVGWRSDPNDAFTFLDREGHIVAYTLYWRDGGIPSRDVDSSIHRHGCAVLVRSDQLAHLTPYLAKDYEVRAWRRFQKSEDDDSMTRSARHQEIPPSPKLGA